MPRIFHYTTTDCRSLVKTAHGPSMIIAANATKRSRSYSLNQRGQDFSAVAKSGPNRSDLQGLRSYADGNSERLRRAEHRKRGIVPDLADQSSEANAGSRVISSARFPFSTAPQPTNPFAHRAPGCHVLRGPALGTQRITEVFTPKQRVLSGH